ncbi:adenylyltransferase/cytidyltransferase family protein [Mucilaginibacter sp. CSA2-8R]|uniref:adenylyltransferase/cytidyltransferase family protein n=1 Tax=Mucilaginibacter sp. CSA2-8R TaxID=3141542 RepID=UPI00315CD343
MNANGLLLKLSSLGVPDEVIKRYQEPHRFYHTPEHLYDIYQQLLERGLANHKTLLLATAYHDVIYNPQSATNEEDSAQYFMQNYDGDAQLKQEVYNVIIDTKTHQPRSELSAIFCDVDLNILRQPLNKLLIYEDQIFKEFQFADFSLYRVKRVEALRQLQTKVSKTDLEALITYVKHRQPQIAVYPGSFNPFHKGHYNVLQKAEVIFDKVIIAKGSNPGKEDSVFEVPAILSNRQIAVYTGLLTDYVNSLSYPVTIIRGLRNSTDLQYELNQYRYLQDLSSQHLKIVSIFCDREFEHISSTGIRQLQNYGMAGAYLL